MTLRERADYTQEDWYKNLSDKGKHVANLIHKTHWYFSGQDKKYRKIVRAFKIVVLVIAMASTIVLGLNVISSDVQISVGMVLSAFITFVTAISSYFNFEEYWMRNIGIHIRLNIIRDRFILEAAAKGINDERIEHYMGELDEIQGKNIKYWQKAIKRI